MWGVAGSPWPLLATVGSVTKAIDWPGPGPSPPRAHARPGGSSGRNLVAGAQTGHDHKGSFISDGSGKTHPFLFLCGKLQPRHTLDTAPCPPPLFAHGALVAFGCALCAPVFTTAPAGRSERAVHIFCRVPAPCPRLSIALVGTRGQPDKRMFEATCPMWKETVKVMARCGALAQIGLGHHTYGRTP